MIWQRPSICYTPTIIYQNNPCCFRAIYNFRIIDWISALVHVGTEKLIPPREKSNINNPNFHKPTIRHSTAPTSNRIDFTCLALIILLHTSGLAVGLLLEWNESFIHSQTQGLQYYISIHINTMRRDDVINLSAEVAEIGLGVWKENAGNLWHVWNLQAW